MSAGASWPASAEVVARGEAPAGVEVHERGAAPAGVEVHERGAAPAGVDIDERGAAPAGVGVIERDMAPAGVEAAQRDAAVRAEERWARAGLSLNRLPRGPLAADVIARGPVAAWQSVVAAKGPILDPEEELVRAADVGARFVIPGDAEWPTGLSDLNRYLAGSPTADDKRSGRDLGEPYGLWVRGGPISTGATAVAVVGARATSAYGTVVAQDLASGLADRGYDVVSGAAFGIDAAAHRGALAVGGRTVAVLACGVDVAYPPAHETLLAVIARDGVVISERPPGAPVGRGAFLQRNRIIAAMTAGTVLVEAGLRSGARNTLAHARELGRSRMVIPGPVTSASSAGCHAALRADPEAQLVTGVAEVVEAVGRIGEMAPWREGPADARDGLGAGARALLELLPAYEVWSTARVGTELALDAADVRTVVDALAAEGLLEVVGAGVRLTTLGRAPTARRG